MSSFFDVLAWNKTKSLLLMLIFTLFFAAVVYLFVILLGGGLFGFAIGVIIIIGYALFSYFVGDKLVLKISKAKEADQHQYKDLYSTVEGLALANQIPMPKVYIINDQSPNAFATGRNRRRASVAVTSGLLSMMSREELQGVLAHEISHILDNDIFFMMIAVVYAGAIGLFAAWARNMLFWGGYGGGRNDEGILLIVALALGILAPIFAFLIRFAISRKREYMADANGARIIRNPQALANALKKIQAYSANPQAPQMAHANSMTSYLYFSSPFKASSIANLLSTHPPIAERIRILEKMY